MATTEAPDSVTTEPEGLAEVGQPGATRRHREERTEGEAQTPQAPSPPIMMPQVRAQGHQYEIVSPTSRTYVALNNPIARDKHQGHQYEIVSPTSRYSSLIELACGFGAGGLDEADIWD